MLYTAEKQPAVFFATCARLIGPEVKLTIEQSLPGNLSMDDWVTLREVLSAVRAGLPSADQMQPGQVFQHVLSALTRQNEPNRGPCRLIAALKVSLVPANAAEISVPASVALGCIAGHG